MTQRSAPQVPPQKTPRELPAAQIPPNQGEIEALLERERPFAEFVDGLSEFEPEPDPESDPDSESDQP